MCCNKEYPKLFCPGKNQRAIDYINDWIDSANVVLQAYGTDLIELQSWREEIERNGTLELLGNLIADVEHLKLYTVDGTTIDLSKLSAITELFTFNNDGAVIQANIVPGDLDAQEEEDPEPGTIPVRVDGEWYHRNPVDLKFYVSDKDGNLTSIPAPLDKIETIIIAWEAANAVPEEELDPDTGEPVVDPFADSEGITAETRIAVTTGRSKHLRGAIQFTGNKNHYLSGIGTFEPLPELPEYGVVKVKYAELLELINNDGLVAGNWYRITDYHTIILSSRATCIGTRFDIIAMALTANTLSENVWFLQNDADTYLIDSNLKSWRGKYCVKNDVTRFNFLNAYKTMMVLNSETAYVRYEAADFQDDNETQYYGWKPLTCDVYTFKADTEPYIATGATIPSNKLHYDSEKDVVFTTVELPEISVVSEEVYGYYEYPYGYNGVRNSSTIYDDETNPIPTAAVTNVYPVSMGAIYSLTDEFGNSAPYDFKSILFTWSEDNVSGFTFSKYTGNNKYDAADASVMNAEPVYRNVIDELYEGFTDSSTQEYQRLSLNRIIHGDKCIENSYGIGCADMYILGECRNNRWSGNSGNNKFKSDVIGNYFYPEFDNNYFEIAVKGNLIMEYFTQNEFKLPTYTAAQYVNNVVPEFEFSHNTIGTNFSKNHCTMPKFIGNVIGKDATDNYFYGTVGTWSTKGHTYLNTLFTGDDYNFVGANIKNHFTKNIIYGGIHSTNIGNNFINNEIGRFVNCNFSDQVQECSFKQCAELVLGGNNINLVFGDVKTTTVDYGCSYLEFDITGGLVNSHVHRGVSGEPGSRKLIQDVIGITVPEGTVVDFVSNNHQERIVK